MLGSGLSCYLHYYPLSSVEPPAASAASRAAASPCSLQLPKRAPIAVILVVAGGAVDVASGGDAQGDGGSGDHTHSELWPPQDAG